MGIALNPGVLAFYVMGSLMEPIRAGTGWSTAQVAFGPALLTALLILTVPLAGNMMDRIGVRKVVLPSQVALGLILIGLGFSKSLVHFYICYGALGVFAAGAVSVGQMRAICTWFDKRRGMAVGLAASGLGIGTMVTPWVVQAILPHGDWRSVYAVLGFLVLIISVPVTALLLHERATIAVNDSSGKAEPSGLGQAEALRKREFWMLIAVFILLSGGLASVSVHLGAIVVKSRMDPFLVPTAVSVMGIGIIAGRLLTGILLDQFFGTRVFAFITTLVAIALAVLLFDVDEPLFLVAVAIIGFGTGAEGDVISYLASRYFGLRALGSISSYLFVANTIGNSLFPLAMAMMVDKSGSYLLSLTFCAVGVLGSALLLFLLGPFPRFEKDEKAKPAH